MKSKKDILKWWEDLGRGKYQGNDLYSFYQSIEVPFTTRQEGIKIYITLYSKRWKYPLYLEFYKRECVRIRGF